jgi:hypothetical protein
MSNTDNDTPKPADSDPPDLEAIGKFLEFAEEEPHGCQMEDGYNPADLLDAANKLYAEVKRLRGEVNKLSKSIHDWDNDERGYEIKRFNPPYPEEEE